MLYIQVKSGRRLAILGLIKFKNIMIYPYLKLHVCNDLAIWSGFPVITQINPLKPHDASKHHFASLKNDLGLSSYT